MIAYEIYEQWSMHTTKLLLNINKNIQSIWINLKDQLEMTRKDFVSDSKKIFGVVSFLTLELYPCKLG